MPQNAVHSPASRRRSAPHRGVSRPQPRAFRALHAHPSPQWRGRSRWPSRRRRARSAATPRRHCCRLFCAPQCEEYPAGRCMTPSGRWRNDPHCGELRSMGTDRHAPPCGCSAPLPGECNTPQYGVSLKRPLHCQVMMTTSSLCSGSGPVPLLPPWTNSEEAPVAELKKAGICISTSRERPPGGRSFRTWSAGAVGGPPARLRQI